MPTSDPSGSGVVASALAAVRRRSREAQVLPAAGNLGGIAGNRPTPPPLARDAGVLADAVEAVAIIHYPSKLTVGGYVCGKCLDSYPCTTMRTLERHLRTIPT